MASAHQIRTGVPPGMMAMANNGQVIMANQVQIANPAALQARLASPYGMVALGGMGGMGMMAATPQPMMTAMPMIAAQNGMGMTMINSGMPQMMQYVQPPAPPSSAQQAYMSPAVTYAAQQDSQSVNPLTNPPPPPAGAPPKDSQSDRASRTSSPSVTKREDVKPEPYDYSEGLQNSNKEQRMEIQKLLKENQKLREKVKKLSREHHQATKSYTVKDGKCPFCLQEMPTNKRKK